MTDLSMHIGISCMPHYLSPLRMGSLARPRSHVKQVPNSRVLAAQRALFRHLYRQRCFVSAVV
jgi:hypothetical protein